MIIIIRMIIIIINPTKLTEKLGHPRVFIIIVHGSNVAGPLASTGSSIFSFTKSMEEPWREGILTGAGKSEWISRISMHQLSQQPTSFQLGAPNKATQTKTP